MEPEIGVGERKYGSGQRNRSIWNEQGLQLRKESGFIVFFKAKKIV